jgi:5-hydroxyisourate hydrolase
MTNSITTHVLDTALGRPAWDVPIVLQVKLKDGAFETIGRGRTDKDGRLRDLLPAGAPLTVGIYRLTFDVGTYYDELKVPAFYPEAQITFHVRDADQHYHVPLLLSPFGYSTYRGS